MFHTYIEPCSEGNSLSIQWAERQSRQDAQGASCTLDDVAGDIEGQQGDDDDLDDDKGQGLVDPHDAMSEEEHNDLEVTMCPVRLVLTKVSSNSDTCAGTHIVSSYKNLPLQSKIRPHSCFLAGPSSFKIWHGRPLIPS